ncbi:MAG: glycyl-radical enzyme activating protein [Chloroflexota bacterium]
MTSGVVFDIQRYSLHDGPGLRTLVFLKGCPLQCLWCSNPESQSKEPDMLYDSERCSLCLACVRACPTGALKHHGDGFELNRALCTTCGVCASACPNNARRISGKEMSVDDVMKVVIRDMPFYRRSGGGVTLGGGEPLAQPAFATSVLTRARAAGIDTAVETSGYGETGTLLAMLEHADHVLFDVKHADPVRHVELTCVSNELIFDNLRALLHVHPDVTVRYPLVPGCNASYDDLAAFGAQMAQLPISPRIEIVPYHRFGEHKYRLLGRAYALEGMAPCAADEVDGACGLLRQFGLSCVALTH